MNNQVVECIKSLGKEMYLKNGKLYNVQFTVYIGETEFYSLKEIRNMLFETWRFIPAPKPGYSAPTPASVKTINDNEEEEQRLAA